MEYHLSSGHSSIVITKFLMEDKYNWEGIDFDVRRVVGNRIICMKSGSARANTITKSIITNEMDDLVECDLIVRSIKNKQKRIFILVIVDHFTKWMKAKILRRKDPETIKNGLIGIFARWQIKPKKILSDNGLEFKNKIITE